MKGLKLAKTHDFCATDDPKLTVVLIHGIASDSSTYNNALEHLEKTKSLDAVRFVTFDLLGSGESLKDDKLNYDYNDQLEALHNSIQALNIATPLILVGHSLGTFIVTKYASTYPDEVARLILISSPIYTPEDFNNPAFEAGIQAFQNSVALKNKDMVTEKSFIASMDNIVLDKNNYNTLINIDVPTTIIYGNQDQIIASYNIPRVLQSNAENIQAVETNGKHGVTEDKYSKLGKLLEKVLDDKAL